MPESSSTQLDDFNRQVLLCQDDAFTLACDLLGDEQEAAEVARQAFEHVFRHKSRGISIRLAAMRRIVEDCLRIAPSSRKANDLLVSLLPEPELLTLYLADHLLLSHAETAIVLRCSQDRIARCLALARWKIANYDRIELRHAHVQDAHIGRR